MDVQAYLAESAQRVDAALERLLPPAGAPPRGLHAAMRHLVFPGGKRLRPALAFAAAEAVGGQPEHALPLAAAVELVHTYSLVHDDLPCMDDDDERRGRPTVHVAYGEATAVLAGDALLAAAFETLAQAPGDAARTVAALRELAHAAGAAQLVGGQADDLDFDPARVDEAWVDSVHRRKTAALFAAAVGGGARLAGAGEPELERLRRFALATGVAFQIADDVLDDEPGAGECSLVALIGQDAARARAEALLQDALTALDPFGTRADALRLLARFAVGRTR
ncbi:MAG: polyprenyl synthetase family protein [Deltaproteobacteria bacterium]|nr:polyprenyl synthetase family protein [Deltaproteobacteria bacterium]